MSNWKRKRRDHAKDKRPYESTLGQGRNRVIVHKDLDDPDQLFVTCYALDYRAGLGTLDWDEAEKIALARCLIKARAIVTYLEDL